MRNGARLLLVIGLLLGGGMIPAHAFQSRVDVFVGQDPATGTTTIYFVDALSGLSTVVDASNGQNFTLLGDYVLYEKSNSGAIMRARANGVLEPHPFIVRSVDTRQVRWVVSQDRKAVAWTLVSAEGTSEAYVAWADGSDLRQLPIPSPTPPGELVPVALTNGQSWFFYDTVQPESAPYTVFTQIAGYDITNEAFSDLPDEPNCSCGAAFSVDGSTFARLEAPRGVGPFNLHVWNLPIRAGIVIPAPALDAPLAGDLLINSTGTLAVYSAASGVNSDTVETQYALVLVDIVTQRQILLGEPGPVRLRPSAFIDGDQALLLTDTYGTYKLDLATGTLRHVSNETYLGTIVLTSQVEG